MASRPLVPELDRELTPVGNYLHRQVELLLDAHRRGVHGASELLRAHSHGPAPLTVEAAREAIARDHGYADWAAARTHADDPVDAGFEAACDAIQWGEVDVLRDLLQTLPELVRARSPFPHHAMLLHHVAANGIEVERQLQTPPNADEIMQLLLEHGAEPDAVCDAYGGRDTTLGLLVSSAHPAAAGVQAALVEELCRGGAHVDGLDDDGAPLWTAGATSSRFWSARTPIRRSPSPCSTAPRPAPRSGRGTTRSSPCSANPRPGPPPPSRTDRSCS